MIKRELYMNRIRPFIGGELIKVMTGIRRSGKSVMLELIKEELAEAGVAPSQMISINFEDMRYSHLQTATALHDEIIKRAEGIEGLSAYSSKMSGAELKETVKNFVEGYEGGFIPFNCGSLPVFSGISVEIKKTDDGYTLSKVTKDGKQIQDDDTFTVTCLATPQHMEAYPTDDNIVFDGGDTSVKDTWTGYISNGDAVLAEPEDYINVR